MQEQQSLAGIFEGEMTEPWEGEFELVDLDEGDMAYQLHELRPMERLLPYADGTIRKDALVVGRLPNHAATAVKRAFDEKYRVDADVVSVDRSGPTVRVRLRIFQ
ncbi:MAG: hypothetical protein GF320_12900 [Armatimonadia bacterium]|nr:hypothetical protein [Armatimonadia bacterium]